MMFFFLFLVIFNNFFTILMAKENTAHVKHALAFPARVPTILAKKIIDILPLVADKAIKFLSK